MRGLLIFLILFAFTSSVVAGNATSPENSIKRDQLSVSLSGVDLILDDFVNRKIISSEVYKSLQKAFSDRAVAEDVARNGTQNKYTAGPIRTFVRSITSKITLLNVLYFLGALIIIGAMTLFMTVGWELFGGFGIFLLSIVYFAVFVYSGQKFWHDREYRLVGGLLHTIALSVVPLGTYGLQRALGKMSSGRNYADYHRYVDPVFIWMELATLGVGLIILFFVPFPFLLAPICFTLVYMSMDTVPLLFLHRSLHAKERSYAGMFFGLCMIGIGAYVQLNPLFPDMESYGDFAFWLFAMGVPLFWGALSTMPQTIEAMQITYMCIQAALIMGGSALNRDLFTWFGCFGFSLPIAKQSVELLNLFWGPRSHSYQFNNFWNFVKQLTCLLLLAHAILTKSPLEFAAAAFGLLLTSYGLPPSSSELRCLFHFSGALGYMFIANNLPLHWTGTFLMYSAGCISLITFFGSPHIDFDSQKSMAWTLYRASLGFFVALVSSTLLPCTQAVWLGALAVVIDPIIWIGQNIDRLLGARSYDGRLSMWAALFRFVWMASLLPMAAYFDSYVVYLMGVVSVTFFSWAFYMRKRHTTPIIQAIILAAAILLQSQLLLIVVGCYLFAYLSWLSWRIFQKSLLFPFVLTLLGCAVIYLGVQYQKYGDALHNFVLTLLPAVGDATTLIPAAAVPYINLVTEYATHFMWTSELLRITMLGNLKWISVAFLGFAIFPFLYKLYLKTKITIDPHAPPVLTIDETAVTPSSRTGKRNPSRLVVNSGGEVSEQPAAIQYIFPDNTDSHGVVLKIRAKKPADFLVSRASLYVDDEAFWDQMRRQYGSSIISIARMIAMPLDLIPNYMSMHDLKLGKEDVELTITLGTGANGTRRICHKTLRGMLETLQNNFETIRVRSTFRSSKAPKYGNLFVINVRPALMLQAMGNKGRE